MRTTSNGIPLLELAEIGSTNAEAMRLGLAGTPAPLWVRAVRQLAGRGRSGRAWTSEPGNLYASLLVRLDCAPTVIHQLSFAAAVAVVAAIRRVADSLPAVAPTLRLKWPNDILIGDAKLVGILAESTIEGPERILAVIGCGLNLAHAPEGLGRATTCLRAFGVDVTPQVMLDALAHEMAAVLAVWDLGRGFAVIRARWLADAGPLGTPMTIHAGRDTVSGTFAGLGPDGALILRDQTGYDHRMTFGDVTLNAGPDDLARHRKDQT